MNAADQKIATDFATAAEELSTLKDIYKEIVQLRGVRSANELKREINRKRKELYDAKANFAKILQRRIKRKVDKLLIVAFLS